MINSKPWVKFGLLTGAALGLIFIASVYTSTERLSILFYLYMFVLAFGIYFTIKEVKSTGRILSYNQALGTGMKTAFFSGLFSAIIIYPFCKFINSDFVNYARQFQIDWLEKTMGYSKEQMDFYKMNQYWIVSPGSVTISEIFRAVFFGFLIALFVSALMRSVNPDRNKNGL